MIPDYQLRDELAAEQMLHLDFEVDAIYDYVSIA